MSVYSGELTIECLGNCVKTLKSAFPDLDANFYTVFASRIKELGFNDERLKASINNVIDTCVYPKPTIAQFVGFDKKINLYTYNQMLKINNELQGKAMELYKPVQIDKLSKPLWASIQDIEKYNLTLFKSNI